MSIRGMILVLVTGIFMCAAFAKPYEDLAPKFDRKKSLAMVRKITKPTVANLDYAAYNANPIRYDPKKQKAKKPAKPVTLKDLTFDGMLSDVCNSLKETPLTDAEKEQPMSWKAVAERLWKVAKDAGFNDVIEKIDGHKWADHNVIKPYQEAVSVYLHKAGNATEMWIKVEFAPWVSFLEGITDEDGDGFLEIYGKANFTNLKEGTYDKAIQWIETDYSVKELNREEITDWIMILASYWYPTYNTDIIDMGEETEWPNKDTEKKPIRKLKGLKVKDPAVVVRGNPYGQKIFMVFVVDGLDKVKREEPKAAVEIKDKKMDTSESQNAKDNVTRWKKELEENGGSYEKWAEKVAPAIKAQKDFLAKLPEEQMGFKGKDTWVFFRKSLEYSAAGELGEQERNKNPLPHLKDMKKFLDAQNVNMLFVVIPTKAEIYYEHLPFETVSDHTAIINPYGRKLLSDAQTAGIEVIDVLPHILKAKAEDETSKENLYQFQDTHWTNRGLQITAQLIADRIKAYSWYKDASADAIELTVRDTTFLRQGDIVSRLPEADQADYPAVELVGQRVFTSDGKPYRGKGNKAAPIMLMGDSFTGVFELVDCKNAGVGSHIAAKTGIPVEIITSWGGGPLVRNKMMRARKDDMGGKRLVIYLMVARDLYNYAQGWDDLKTE